MSSKEEVLNKKIEQGLKFKDEGGSEFKAGNFSQALKKYHYALLYLRGLNDSLLGLTRDRNPENLKESDITDLEKDISNIHSNMALCQLRLGRLNQITRCANAALEVNPFNKKAKFRLAQGLIREGAVINAAEILDKLEKDSPNDPAFAAERRQIESREKLAEAKQRKEFAGMFDRAKD
ncbi:hypothetical protein IWW55_000736 [Coemansia sp. RSA 2706]|nr:hypothetical protein LPJ63_000440 [Coemansia sp. RSA 2711]KAJ2307890.1 hypothetical protein IWW55_000736 [Coemansia sp. RSA 2706]KAJ2328560.1 hypothetical protein IWW51_001132 [Coemansia sp. RSA 2702]